MKLAHLSLHLIALPWNVWSESKSGVFFSSSFFPLGLSLFVLVVLRPPVLPPLPLPAPPLAVPPVEEGGARPPWGLGLLLFSVILACTVRYKDGQWERHDWSNLNVSGLMFPRLYLNLNVKNTNLQTASINCNASSTYLCITVTKIKPWRCMKCCSYYRLVRWTLFKTCWLVLNSNMIYLSC